MVGSANGIECKEIQQPGGPLEVGFPIRTPWKKTSKRSQYLVAGKVQSVTSPISALRAGGEDYVSVASAQRFSSHQELVESEIFTEPT